MKEFSVIESLYTENMIQNKDIEHSFAFDLDHVQNSYERMSRVISLWEELLGEQGSGEANIDELNSLIQNQVVIQEFIDFFSYLEQQDFIPSMEFINSRKNTVIKMTIYTALFRDRCTIQDLLDSDEDTECMSELYKRFLKQPHVVMENLYNQLTL